MSLRFVLGRAGSGKSSLCLEKIRNTLRKDPQGLPIIFLVPEQATYQMEVALCNTPDLGGIMRAQVLSFKRLAWRVLAETGGVPKTLISEMGKRMLFRKLILEHKLELKAFARSATRPGMADLLARTIGEMKTYRLTPEDLRLLNQAQGILADKLNDIAVLYEAFEESINERMLDPNDELTILAERVNLSQSIRHAQIWVDGFKGFTPQELHALRELLLASSQMVITLPIDPQLFMNEKNDESDFWPAGQEIFAGPWQTYQALQRLAWETNVEIEPPIKMNEIHRFREASLQHLEKYYFHYPMIPYALSCDAVHIIAAVNKRAEIEGVARELRDLAREKGLRWNEMAVLSRELNGYDDLVEQLFTAYEIPFFIDNKKPVVHHPLIEFLLSVLELVVTDWGYEPLFRCLKTDFFPLSRDNIDCLENYCLAHGIKGSAWRQKKEWVYRRQWILGDPEEQNANEIDIQNEINAIRSTVYSILAPFIDALAMAKEDSGFKASRITEVLYDLIERLNIPVQLKRWAEEMRQAGRLSEARLQEQIWQAVLDLLDEMVAALGEELLSLEDYSLIMASGLEDLRLGLIPPGLDQVLVGSLERSRNPEVKVLFVIGASEGVLPARPVSDGVFDLEEREVLHNLGIILAPKGKEQLFEEQYFIYTALTRASDYLYLSYPLTDEEGKGIGISPVVNRLKALFPELKEEYLGSQDELKTISHPGPLLQHYATQLRAARESGEFPLLWQAVGLWLKGDPHRQSSLKLLDDGLKTRNQEESLSRSLTRRLCGKRLLASVSRLEQFARCPFSHFARYGLRLKERPNYILSNPDMGNFFHWLLRDFAQEVTKRHLDWGNLRKEESWALVNELAEKITPQLQNEILLSNSRYRYITHKLKRTVHHAVRILGEHSRRGKFMPISLELGFGPHEELPGLEIPLSEGESLILRGQIDRIDRACLDNGQIYLRIIDYKSRETNLLLDDIYYGLKLQLLTYLDTALEGAEILLTDLNEVNSVWPAGFLYFPVVEPELESTSPLSPEDIELKRLQKVKVQGYLLADKEILQAMDSALAAQKSDLLGIQINSNGDFRKGTKVLTQEQFELLRQHLRTLLYNTGEKIMEGEVSLSPYARGKTTGCQYCSFKPVCHFDLTLEENVYRNLPMLPPEVVWPLIQKGCPAETDPISKQKQHPEEQRPLSRPDKAREVTLNWLGEETGEDKNE